MASQVGSVLPQYTSLASSLDPEFFSSQMLEEIRTAIRLRLRDIRLHGKRVEISDKTLSSSMGAVFSNNFDTNERMKERVISDIVKAVEYEAGMRDVSNSYTAWSQKRDGTHGILSHSKPKVRTNRTSMYIGMKY